MPMGSHMGSKTTIIEHDCIIRNRPVNRNDYNFDTCVAMYDGELRCYWGYWLWNTGEYYLNYNQKVQVVFVDNTGA